MKLTQIAVALSASLFAQVALADQPCGNYGISTNQQPCVAQQQPVYAQPPQTSQPPCAEEQVQVQAQAPVQTPAPRYGYGIGYRARYNTYGYQQPTYTSRWQSRRAEAAGPDYGRGVEVGLRGIQDAASLEIGAGLYVRAHQQGGQQRLALELSADALSTDLLAQGAVMLYLNPNGFIKPFGLLGGGLEVSGGDAIAQAGVGLDIEITRRLTVSGDVRAVEGISGNVDTLNSRTVESSSASFLLGNIGVSRKF